MHCEEIPLTAAFVAKGFPCFSSALCWSLPPAPASGAAPPSTPAPSHFLASLPSRLRLSEGVSEAVPFSFFLFSPPAPPAAPPPCSRRSIHPSDAPDRRLAPVHSRPTMWTPWWCPPHLNLVAEPATSQASMLRLSSRQKSARTRKDVPALLMAAPEGGNLTFRLRAS